MADSAPKVAAEERFEALDVIDRKAQTLANQIKKKQAFHCIHWCWRLYFSRYFTPGTNSNIIVSSADLLEAYLTFGGRMAPGLFEPKEDSALGKLSVRCKLFLRLRIWRL